MTAVDAGTNPLDWGNWNHYRAAIIALGQRKLGIQKIQEETGISEGKVRMLHKAADVWTKRKLSTPFQLLPTKASLIVVAEVIATALVKAEIAKRQTTIERKNSEREIKATELAGRSKDCPRNQKPRYSAEQRTKVVAALNAGLTVMQARKKTGVGKTSVEGIAKAESIVPATRTSPLIRARASGEEKVKPLAAEFHAIVPSDLPSASMTEVCRKPSKLVLVLI